jgi:hypothetical protein
MFEPKHSMNVSLTPEIARAVQMEEFPSKRSSGAGESRIAEME